MDAEVGHMICFLEWFCHNSKLDLGHVCIGFESFSLGAEKNQSGHGLYSTTCGGIRIFWILLEAGWGLKRKENTNLYITLFFNQRAPCPTNGKADFRTCLTTTQKHDPGRLQRVTARPLNPKFLHAFSFVRWMQQTCPSCIERQHLETK